MTTTTKTRAKSALPMTLDDVARNKLRSHLETYRTLLRRQADGEALSESDLSLVAAALEALGLPDYCWPRDLEAFRRHAVVQAKQQTALNAEPANQEKAAALFKELELLQAKMRTLQDEYRRAKAGASKPTAYLATLAELEAEHPQALAPLNTAVELRLTELNRRRATNKRSFA